MGTITQVLRMNSHRETTRGHLEVPNLCPGQGENVEGTGKVIAKKRHWIRRRGGELAMRAELQSHTTRS